MAQNTPPPDAAQQVAEAVRRFIASLCSSSNRRVARAAFALEPEIERALTKSTRKPAEPAGPGL